MKKTVQLLVGLIMIISSTSCKKDKTSSSRSKMELLTEKPWVLISEEVFHNGLQKWVLQGGSSPTEFLYFYSDGRAETKNSSGGGSPSAYPILRRATWSFADGENSLNYRYIFYMKSPTTITELTSSKLVLVAEEDVASGALQHRYTHAHP